MGSKGAPLKARGGGVKAKVGKPTDKPRHRAAGKPGALTKRKKLEKKEQKAAQGDTESGEGPGQDTHKLDVAAKKKKLAAAAARKAKQGSKGSFLQRAEHKALLEKGKAISSAAPEDQADWVWQHHAIASGATTSLERDGFSGSCMLPLDAAGSSAGLQKALKAQVQAPASKSAAANGAPVALVLAASAVAANNIVKKLRDPALGRVAKLFAKHIKVEEQSKQLNEAQVLVGVGTPGRVLRLVELEALKLDRLALLVVDVQLDAKALTMLDLPETRSDFSKLFGVYLLPRVVSGSAPTKICLADGSVL